MNPIHLNIDTLINADSVEWECLEFKEGYNPERILRTICAFANDINNWGGGYIVVGFKEQSGKPIFPPEGLESTSVDAIQKKLRELCSQLDPYYAPVFWPHNFDGRTVLVIWVPTGDERPYRAPKTLGEKGEKRYFIRQGSSTVIANSTEEKRLKEMASKIKFEGRLHSTAQLEAIEKEAIISYLNSVGSTLYNEALGMNLSDLCKSMLITRGTGSAQRPLNIGLLFFSTTPEKYFPGAYIDVIIFKDDEGTEFIEKSFKGPLDNQIKTCLEYLQAVVIKEKTRKVQGQAESKKILNYPYQAIEEAVVNAVYHRSYEVDNVTEIRVFPKFLQIISYPGPIPPVNEKTIQQDRIDAREYRNPRIGQILKEIKLAEERGTGISTIRREMRLNESLAPEFDFGDENTHFMIILRIHPEWFDEKPFTENRDQFATISNEQQLILERCSTGATVKELYQHLQGKMTIKQINAEVKTLLLDKYLVKKEIKLVFGLFKTIAFYTTNRGSNVLRQSF